MPRATVDTGYEIKLLPTYVVERDISVTISATLKEYRLTISKNAGVQFVTARRTHSLKSTATIGELSSGAILYYGDNIEFDAEPKMGYVLDKNYKYGMPVYGDVVLNVVATLRTYAITKQVNDGVSSVSVTKTFNAATNAFCSTILNSGDKVSYGDVITVTATPKEGYALDSYTQSHTVRSNLTISPTASPKKFQLSFVQGTNVSSISVRRMSTKKSGASLGVLADGSDLYYGDIIAISAAPKSGYKLTSLLVNHSSFTSGNSTTVSSNIEISVTGIIYNCAPVLKSIIGTNTYGSSKKSFTLSGTVENPNGDTVSAKLYMNGALFDTRQISAGGYTTFQSYYDNVTYSSVTLKVVFDNSSAMTTSITVTPSDFHPQISAARS